MTDIVGSTSRWEREFRAMTQATARFEALAMTVVTAAGGNLIKTRGEGDSTFSVFNTAADALNAAWNLDIAVREEPWPTSEPLLLRCSIHTGDAEVRDGDVYGPVPNRCARLRAAAQPGQTLVSAAAARLASARLPSGAHLVDLGIHALRDLLAPERVFELSPTPTSGHPPIASLSQIGNNLPFVADRFVGRDAELNLARRRIAEHRLVTLTGPGGSGKTRLALQTAAESLDAFPGGVWWVRLEALRPGDDPLVPLAAALGVNPAPRRIADLAPSLQGPARLIVLDNAERIRTEVAQLVRELRSLAPAVRILVTSREPLRLSFEAEVRVPPLSLPPVNATPSELEASEGGRLYVERLRRHHSAYTPSPSDAPIIAAIVRRLDGIPLALELAAARAATLEPRALLNRLERGLDVLSTEYADLEERQRTVRATVAWSLDLLEPAERTLFRDLCHFRAPFTLEDAETVDGDHDGRFLDRFDSLIRKSLVIADVVDPATSHPRHYRLLQTYRELGRETLGHLDPAARDRLYARWPSDPPGNAFPALREGRPNETALVDALLHARDPRALDACYQMRDQWHRFGPLSGAIERLQRALELAGPKLSSRQGQVWNLLGVLQWLHGHYDSARTAYAKAISIGEALDEPLRVASTRVNQGILLAFTGDLEGGYAALAPAVRTLEEAGGTDGVLHARISLGRVLDGLGRYEEAIAELDRALQDTANDTSGLNRIRARLNRVSALLGHGDRSLALDDLRRAWSELRAEPDPTLLANAYLLGARLLITEVPGDALLLVRAFREAYGSLERPPSFHQLEQAVTVEREALKAPTPPATTDPRAVLDRL